MKQKRMIDSIWWSWQAGTKNTYYCVTVWRFINSFGANAPVEGRQKERLYVEARAVATERAKTLVMLRLYSTNKGL